MAAKRPNQIALTLPPHQREPLDEIAAALRRDRSELIREALAEWLSRKQAVCAHCNRYRVIAGYCPEGALCGECM